VDAEGNVTEEREGDGYGYRRTEAPEPKKKLREGPWGEEG